MILLKTHLEKGSFKWNFGDIYDKDKKADRPYNEKKRLDT